MHLPNELIWFGFMLLDFTLALLIYRFFGKEGLFVYIAMAIITCNLQVQKLVVLFGLTTTLGNVLYGSIFLVTDLLSEVHGKKEAQKAVWFGFIAMLLMTLFMQISLSYTPSPYDQNQQHMQALFGFMPRIAIGSLLAYLISQLNDVWLFNRIRALTGRRMLWLRNNASTVFAQLLDTAVFTLIAFAPLPYLGAVPGFETWTVIWQVGVSSFIIKLMVALFDTPFIYIGRAIGERFHLPIAAKAEPQT